WCFYFFLRGLREKPIFFVWSGLVGSYVLFAKSLFGGLPLATLFLYLVLTRQFKSFRQPLLWVGLLLYVLPYGAWVLTQYQMRGQEFLSGHYGLFFRMSSAKSENDRIYDYV